MLCGHRKPAVSSFTHKNDKNTSTEIREWISNSISIKVRAVITDACPNFNGQLAGPL